MDYLKIYKNVPLDPDYKYTIDFESATAQTNFFNTIPVLEFSDTEFEFISEFEPVKVEASIESLKTANYMIFRNYNQTRDYFCFITRKEYVNPNCTKIYFKLDLLQTFMFDYTIGESFIEREHQDRWEYDNIFNKYVPKYNLELENLEAGSDYKLLKRTTCRPLANPTLEDLQDSIIWYEVLATEPVSNISQYDPNHLTSTYWHASDKLVDFKRNIGVYVYLIPVIPEDLNISLVAQQPDNLVLPVLSEIPDEFFKSEAVISIRKLDYAPLALGYEYEGTDALNRDKYKIMFAGGYDSDDPHIVPLKLGSINFSNLENTNWGGINLTETMVGRPRVINLRYRDYETYNNIIGNFIEYYTAEPTFNINADKVITNETKLLASQYRFFQITDYTNEPLKVKPELLGDQAIKTHSVKYIQNLGVMSKYKVWVEGYNGDDGEEYNNINNTLSELPLFNSAYTSYISQNKASATTGMAVTLGASAAMLAVGVATGGIGLLAGAGAVIGGMQQIGNAMVKMQDLKDTPDSIRQSGNNADFDLVATPNKIIVKEFEIMPQFKNKIFNYFYRYGYKCNDFKVPNTRSRYYFNYIKTIEINIVTNIDSEYRKQIEDIYNNGITIWHYRNANTFRGVNNYQYENCEISIVGEHPEQEEVIING